MTDTPHKIWNRPIRIVEEYDSEWVKIQWLDNKMYRTIRRKHINRGETV